MINRITIGPAVCHGKPCMRGLRYPGENILEWLASGMTTDEMLNDYEDLVREDVLAVLAYAARLSHIKNWNDWQHENFGRCATSAALGQPLLLGRREN